MLIIIDISNVRLFTCLVLRPDIYYSRDRNKVLNPRLGRVDLLVACF